MRQCRRIHIHLSHHRIDAVRLRYLYKFYREPGHVNISGNPRISRQPRLQQVQHHIGIFLLLRQGWCLLLSNINDLTKKKPTTRFIYQHTLREKKKTS